MTKDGASLTLAVWQGSSVWGDIGVNLQKIETVAKQAADTNADLLVFPECFLTGYYKEGDLTEIAAQVDDRCMAALASVSETLDITLVVGTYELTEAGLYNSAFVFDPEIGIVGPYRKQMLYGEWEKKNFRPGTQPLVFCCRGLKVGVLICFDVEFPERVRELAQAGIDLLVVPTALMEPYDIVSTALVPTRALENGIFAAYSNRIDSEDNLRYVGLSCIVGPDGKELARAGSDQEGLIDGTIDADRLKSVRAEVFYLQELDDSQLSR
jgi:5-aminopentanamidase